MARRPPRDHRPPADDRSVPPPPAVPDRDRIIAAFRSLLAERSLEDVGFSQVAARAGVPLATMRVEFSSTTALLAGHIEDIDRQVLDGTEADMAEEPPRERLFDVLMRRFDVLAPHKEMVRSLTRSAARDPALALTLNGLAVRSQQWMLTAAEISATGLRGMVRAQGMALLYAQVVRVWLEDDEPDLARTMSALDRALASGQRWSGFLDDLCRVPACFFRRRRGADRPRRRSRRDDLSDEVLPI
jgi:AcrR family transcriptional regulator